MGIFHAITTVLPWIFPNNAGGEIGAADTVTLSTTPTNAALIAAIGGAGSTTANELILAAAGIVPEPSSTALLGVGTLFFSARRHRSTCG